MHNEFCVSVSPPAEPTMRCGLLKVSLRVQETWANVPYRAQASEAVTATLSLLVQNEGHIVTTTPVTVTLAADYDGGLIPHETIIPPLGCCGNTAIANISWPDFQRGTAFTATLATPYTQTSPVRVTVASHLVIQDVWAPHVHGDLPVTATLYATVANEGNLNTGEPTTVSFYIPETTVQPYIVLASDLAAFGGSDTVSITWPYADDGFHEFCVRAATSYTETQATCARFIVNPKQVYLPLVIRETP